MILAISMAPLLVTIPLIKWQIIIVDSIKYSYFPSANERPIELRFDNLERILAISMAPLSVIWPA